MGIITERDFLLNGLLTFGFVHNLEAASCVTELSYCIFPFVLLLKTCFDHLAVMCLSLLWP